MEAIGEAIAAIVAALLEFVLLIFELLFTVTLSLVAWLADLCAFLIACIIKGIGPASQQRQKSQQQRLARQAAKREERQAAGKTSWKSCSPSPPVPALIVLVGIGILIGWVVISERTREARLQSTRTLVRQWADQLADEEKKKQQQGKPLLPVLLKSDRQELPAQDAWKQPLELFIDETPAGTLLVVRSHGPDRKSGTLDDLLEIRPVGKNPQQLVNDLAGGLADRAKGWIRKRIPDPAP